MSQSKRNLTCVLSREECQLLLKAAKKSDPFLKMSYLLCLTMIMTGLRSTEIIQLTHSQIDFEQSVILIKKKQEPLHELVSLPKEVAKALKLYINHPALIFWTSQGNDQIFFFKDKPFNTHTLTKHIKHLAKEAGIKKNVTPRCLRYTFAYNIQKYHFKSPLILKSLLRIKRTESLLRYLICDFVL